MRTLGSLIAVIAILTGYGAFASWKWWSLAASHELKCENRALTQAIDEIDRKIGVVSENIDRGNEATRDIQVEFAPIKETVREIAVPGDCAGEFDVGVQRALDAAVDSANTGLPAASNR